MPCSAGNAASPSEPRPPRRRPLMARQTVRFSSSFVSFLLPATVLPLKKNLQEILQAPWREKEAGEEGRRQVQERQIGAVGV